MSIKSHKIRLKKALNASGVYSPKLDEQIALTARQLVLLDRLEAELESSPVTDIVISAAGTEKKVLSPLIQSIEKLYGQLTDSYKALGLNYNANAANVRESSAGRADDALADLMKR